MSITFTFIDDLIRDYFPYHNLILTSRSFDNEISKLSPGQYRSDIIIEKLRVYIQQLDINGLNDYWAQIEQHLLLTLIINEQQLKIVFSKIRLNFYRCYLIHAVKLSKMDKINEFFDILTKYFQQTIEWTKEWYSLPFIKNPEEDQYFQIYFSKQWNELFWISLQNFLSIAFYHMSLPKICSLEDDLSAQSLTFGDSSVRRYSETFDDNRNLSTEKQCSTNSTILSKLRSKFSKDIRSDDNIISGNKLSPTGNPLKVGFLQPIQESTQSNQISFTADISTLSQMLLLSSKSV